MNIRDWARHFLRMNLLIIALPFGLVLDLSLMVCIAMGMPVRRSKRVAWAVLTLLILSLISFALGWSTTFMSAQYCADISLKYPPCHLAYLCFAVFDLLHAFVRLLGETSALLFVAARNLADHPIRMLYTCALMLAAHLA